MADPATLRALLERVKSATGADREIDGWFMLLQAGFRPETRGNDLVGVDDRGIAMPIGRADPGQTQRNFYLFGLWAEDTPAYTASVDAALALIERVLPDARILLVQDKTGDGLWFASLWRKLREDMGSTIVGRSLDCHTPALALCGALLATVIEALEAEEHDET